MGIFRDAVAGREFYESETNRIGKEVEAYHLAVKEFLDDMTKELVKKPFDEGCIYAANRLKFLLKREGILYHEPE